MGRPRCREWEGFQQVVPGTNPAAECNFCRTRMAANDKSILSRHAIGCSLMPSHVKEHHLRCLQQRRLHPSKRKRGAPEQISNEENEERSNGTSNVACSQYVGENGSYDPFFEDNLHALTATNAAPLLPSMCTCHEPQAPEATRGAVDTVLSLQRAESAITTNFVAQMPGWSMAMSGLWDDLADQGVTETPSLVDCSMALFSGACSSTPGSGGLGSCPISPGPVSRPFWRNEAEDPAEGGLPGVSKAADGHAEASIYNSTEAGVCADLHSNECGSCLVRTDAAACSAFTDASDKSQGASEMLLQRDSPQPDAVPDQKGTASAVLSEVPAVSPSALLALPSSEAQQAAAKQVIKCGLPLQVLDSSPGHDHALQAHPLASPLQETAALVQGVLAAADAERVKALRQLKLLKRCISDKDVEVEALRQERDCTVADAQAAQERTVAADQKLLVLGTELVNVRAAAEKVGRELTKENNALKCKLRDQQSLNETIQTSSQSLRLQLEAAKDEIRRLQANVARSLSQNQQLAAVLAEARAELQGSRACAEERAQALQLQVQDLWCRLAAAESMAAAATRESLGEFALQKAAQQAKFSQGLSEQTGRLQAAHEAELMVIKESAERKVSQQLSQMIQGSLYSEANTLVDSKTDEGSE